TRSSGKQYPVSQSFAIEPGVELIISPLLAALTFVEVARMSGKMRSKAFHFIHQIFVGTII
ncbi:MAG TPA: hypothetical protein VK106_06810, partial [Balneolaceae bacterium]|nr:hypothetical protein [Balneolaceae bacterium]